MKPQANLPGTSRNTTLHDDRLTALYQSLDFDRPLDYGDPKDRALYVAGMQPAYT
jgi:hypothetical protein